MIVVAAVIKKEGKILLAERISQFSGAGWEFPGGKVETDESPEAALRREIYEELGVKIKIVRFLGSVSLAEESGSRLIAYEAELLNDDFKLNSHYQIRWIRPEELNAFNLLPADRELIKDLNKKNYFDRPFT